MRPSTYRVQRTRSAATPATEGVLQRACACGGSPGPTGECAACRRERTLQPKLTVNTPGDRYEQEADRVAEAVMRRPAPELQRQRAPEEDEEERLQAKPLAITPLLQRRATDDDAATAPPVVHDVLRAPGQPLDAMTRSFMEPRFGHDFSQVRVHADARAAASARSVRAQAYTVGRNVVFGAGRYAPGTATGRKLLAHELTHVVQQQVNGSHLQRKKEKTPCAVHTYDASDPKDTAVIPDDKSGIGVTSVADMVTKVNAYVNDEKNMCSCVNHLEINGHGADGNQSVGAGLGNDADKILDADSKDDHLKQVASIKFCSTGLFLLLGCHVGRSRGKELLSKLAKILPGKLIGGAKHYTAGTGLGSTKVTGAGDAPKTPMSERDPFLTSPNVRWHIVVDGKEYVINGDETTSEEGRSKLKKASKIKVITPDGEVVIK